MARPCKACGSPHRARIDELLSAGAPYRVVVEELGEKGEKFVQSQLSRHKPHVISSEEVGDIERMARGLEAEAAAAAPTIEPLYRLLARGVRGMAANPKPPSPTEMVKLTQSIRELTNLGPKQEMMMAYARRAFAPGGALHPDTPTIANGRLRYYRDGAGQLVEILDGQYHRTVEE